MDKKQIRPNLPHNPRIMDKTKACTCFLCQPKNTSKLHTFPPYNYYTCKYKLQWENMYYIDCCCIQHPPPCDNTNEVECSCPRCHCPAPRLLTFYAGNPCKICYNKNNLFYPCLHLEGRCIFNR